MTCVLVQERRFVHTHTHTQELPWEDWSDAATAKEHQRFPENPQKLKRAAIGRHQPCQHLDLGFLVFMAFYTF